MFSFIDDKKIGKVLVGVAGFRKSLSMTQNGAIF